MPTVDKSSHGYDRLARVYRWLEYPLFGNDLQRARIAMLQDLPPCRHALVLGDGNGRLLEQFCLIQPNCDVTSIDHSDRMIQLQRERLNERRQHHRVSWITGDARDHRPEAGTYDLLITAFFLDCFSKADLQSALPQWIAGVQPGGSFYCVDFALPKHGWQRVRARLYLSLMHWFFRWQTDLPNRRLVDLDEVLSRQPIFPIESQTLSRGLIQCTRFRVDAVRGEEISSQQRHRNN